MDRQDGLRRLLWEWDRIGVADLAPDDEYDGLVEPLLARLRRGADRAAISAYLAADAAGHFGLDPAHQDTGAVADRLLAWLAAAAAPTGRPEPTRCPACGAGVEQSSDPEQLFRSVCYCGHPRYYDYKHRDGSCPCQTPAP